jgi:hypothetical protein
MRVRERVLLPTGRAVDGYELIITDGFSCREQIEQSTGPTQVHIDELLQRAIHNHDAEADVAREPPGLPSITRTMPN